MNCENVSGTLGMNRSTAKSAVVGVLMVHGPVWVVGVVVPPNVYVPVTTSAEASDETKHRTRLVNKMRDFIERLLVIVVS